MSDLMSIDDVKVGDKYVTRTGDELVVKRIIADCVVFRVNGNRRHDCWSMSQFRERCKRKVGAKL